MDVSSWFTLGSLVFLLVGVAVGVAAGHFWSPAIGEAKRLREDVERLQREHDTYRASVNSHFRKTADLVGQMTKSYAAVYDHLAGGAQRFCGDFGADSSIPFEPLPGALASPTIETAAEEAASAAEEFAAAEDPSAGDELAAGDFASRPLEASADDFVETAGEAGYPDVDAALESDSSIAETGGTPRSQV